MIDMHLHSLWSDGSLTTEELVKRLQKQSITHAVLTDHDCVLGNNDFAKFASQVGIKTIPGVEIETYYDLKKSKYLHMLCYNYQDYNGINNYLENLRLLRIEAIKEGIKKLETRGINTDIEEIQKMSEGRHLIINHICIYLEKIGFVKSRFEAYNMFTDPTSPLFVKYPKPTIEETIKQIEKFGGVAVLAHPKRISMDKSELEAFVSYLCSIGLYGLETYYGFNTDEETMFSEYLSDKYSLVRTVGSDWHCDSDNINFGSKKISQDRIKILRKELFNE